MRVSFDQSLVPGAGVVIIPSQWYLDVAWAHLQGDIILEDGGQLPRELQTLLGAVSFFTLRSVITNRVLHWCIVPQRCVEGLVQVRPQCPFFVFYPNRGWVSNVEAMLSYWMGPYQMALIGDSRFLAISQCLTRGSLYWNTNQHHQGFDASQTAAAEAASIRDEEEERGRRRKSRGEIPPSLTKRLCRDRPCAKAVVGEPLCVVCRENVASTVFSDCGHVSACEQCIYDDWDKGSGKLACYMCRTPCVTGPVSLYISEKCM